MACQERSKVGGLLKVLRPSISSVTFFDTTDIFPSGFARRIRPTENGIHITVRRGRGVHT